MLDIKVIDNFLDKNIFHKLNNEFLNNNFFWYYQNGKVFENDGDFQFTHIFYENNKINSDRFYIIEPFLSLLNVKSLVKVKLNFTPKDTVLKKFEFHIDNDFNCNTAVFYLNTNNGFTEFDDDTRVDSIENRLVTFDGSVHHSSSTCTDKKNRLVLAIS